jgi:hypothetical protein
MGYRSGRLWRMDEWMNVEMWRCVGRTKACTPPTLFGNQNFNPSKFLTYMTKSENFTYIV